MKKLVSFLLCIAMLCGVVVVPVQEDAGVSTCAIIEIEDFYGPVYDDSFNPAAEE